MTNCISLFTIMVRVVILRTNRPPHNFETFCKKVSYGPCIIIIMCYNIYLKESTSSLSFLLKKKKKNQVYCMSFRNRVNKDSFKGKL